jgi:hypothetical protein
MVLKVRTIGKKGRKQPVAWLVLTDKSGISFTAIYIYVIIVTNNLFNFITKFK